jgi:hypothetical protein
MGANLGAGLFVTSVITGVVAYMSECRVNPISFYRDIIAYIVDLEHEIKSRLPFSTSCLFSSIRRSKCGKLSVSSSSTRFTFLLSIPAFYHD